MSPQEKAALMSLGGFCKGNICSLMALVIDHMRDGFLLRFGVLLL
jgi:hypothetical protein